jgi:hypothetical protein
VAKKSRHDYANKCDSIVRVKTLKCLKTVLDYSPLGPAVSVCQIESQQTANEEAVEGQHFFFLIPNERQHRLYISIKPIHLLYNLQLQEAVSNSNEYVSLNKRPIT